MFGWHRRRGALRAARRTVAPTGVERRFRDRDIIVSKTDPRGRITYANDIFIAVSGYREEELVGAPHSIIRHPDMPRCIFQLMWEHIQQGREVFAYVKNLCKNGDHYWVSAHVTATMDGDGRILGYHSCRRTAPVEEIRAIEPIYAELLAIEQAHGDRKEGLRASRARLDEILAPFDGDTVRFQFRG